MRRFVAILGVVAILALTAGPVVAEGDRGVPFKGTMWGDDVTFGPVTPGRCVEKAGVADALVSFTGSGYATHLGWVEVIAEHCSDFNTGTYGDGKLTITAANGEILKGAYTGGFTTAPCPLCGFQDAFTFVDGGTGRFAVASGGGTEVGVFNVVTLDFWVRMEGVIWYDKG